MSEKTKCTDDPLGKLKVVPEFPPPSEGLVFRNDGIQVSDGLSLVPFSGGCACGAIRYECSATPVSMVNCHCRDCQKASGSAYSATVVVTAASLKLLKGQPKEHDGQADSGNIARRAFCPDCGVPLFARSSAKSDLIGIKASSLDDPSWFRPAADVWTCSAQPWDYMNPKIPKFSKNRAG